MLNIPCIWREALVMVLIWQFGEFSKLKIRQIMRICMHTYAHSIILHQYHLGGCFAKLNALQSFLLYSSQTFRCIPFLCGMQRFSTLIADFSFSLAKTCVASVAIVAKSPSFLFHKRSTSNLHDKINE